MSGCASGPARPRVRFGRSLIPFLLRSLCLFVLWITTYTFRILHAHCPHICHRCPIVLQHPHPPLRTPLAQYLRRDALRLLPLYLTCFYMTCTRVTASPSSCRPSPSPHVLSALS
jgi:hypothetical protein